MTRTLYYHGGPRGLKGWLKPPGETGVANTSQYGGAGIHRRDRVYVTTDPMIALMWACGQPRGGCVYVVEPIGSVEVDPDYKGTDGESLQCERARIIAERPVKGKLMRKVRRQVFELP